MLNAGRQVLVTREGLINVRQVNRAKTLSNLAQAAVVTRAVPPQPDRCVYGSRYSYGGGACREVQILPESLRKLD